MSSRPTPLRAIGRGVLAGVAGTAAMTVAQELWAKAQSSGDGGEEGGDAAQQAPPDPWEQASTPAKVARRISEGVFRRPVAPERITLLTHAMHWAYGTTWGAVYGIVQGSAHPRRLRGGLTFGGAVWAMSYVQLVPMGLYEPPWEYDVKDTATELGYHLVYGTAVACAYGVLDRSSR